MRLRHFFLAMAALWAAQADAASPVRKTYLEGCGPYLVGEAPGQVHPDRKPRDAKGEALDREILQYLGKVPVVDLEGEALATLLFRLRALATRTDAVAGALNRFNLHPPDDPAAEWDSPAIERTLALEWERLRALHAAVGTDFSRRDALDALYQSLAERRAPSLWIAAAFNAVGVNGGHWTPEFVDRKFAPKPSPVEAIFARWRAARPQDGAGVAPFVAELRAELGRAAWVLGEIEREGIAAPTDVGTWTEAAVDGLWRQHLGGPTARERSRNGNHRAKGEALVKAALAEGKLEGERLARLLRDLAQVPLTEEAVASVLHDEVPSPGGGYAWSPADVRKAVASDRERQVAHLRASGNIGWDSVDEWLDRLTADGFGDRAVTEIFNAVPVAGGRWSRDMVKARRKHKPPLRELDPLTATRLVLRSKEDQERLLLIQATNQNPYHAALTLMRRAVPPPPGRTQWTADVVRKLKQDAIELLYARHRTSSFALRTTVDAFLADLDELDFSYDEMAEALNARRVPPVFGKMWRHNTVRARVVALREGAPLQPHRRPRFPWRSAPKDFDRAAYLQALAARKDLSRDEATEAYLELVWFGYPPTHVAEWFRESDVQKAFGKGGWYLLALTRAAAERQEEMLVQFRAAKPTDDESRDAMVRRLDAVVMDPSRIAGFLDELCPKTGGARWESSEVAQILLQRAGARDSGEQRYFWHPSFEAPNVMAPALEAGWVVVRAQEASVKGTELPEPLPGDAQIELVRLFNYLKYRSARAKDPSQSAALLADARRFRNVLWQTNQRFVRYVVRGLPSIPIESYEDWVAEGAAKLPGAIEAFDFRRGNGFSEYMRVAITRAIQGALLYQRRHTNRLRLSTDLTGIDDDGDYVSTVADDGEGTESASLEAREIRGKMERTLRRLKPRTQEVLRLLFGLGGGEPMTLEDAGLHFGLSKERVRQIRDDGLEKLRYFMGVELPLKVED